jgi:drug/metabolite transporter (DMT)-like permease
MARMKRRDIADLLLLAALWGASFLFMRMSAAEFGPVALMALRVAGASAFLLPLLLLRRQAAQLAQHWKAIAVVGLLSSAFPFLLFGCAALVLSAALMSVFNATAPIWGALVAWLWLGERLSPSRLFGLALGLSGVIGLAWGKADFKPNEHGISPALGIAASVVATVLYGVAANWSRRFLGGVPAMAVAAGSQLASTIVLVPLALFFWPAAMPSGSAWAGAIALALLCTGVAYILYFRLIANAGAGNAISVTLLIPAFAMAWGWLFLNEQPTPPMLAGCAVILLGTALSTGLLRWPSAQPA